MAINTGIPPWVYAQMGLPVPGQQPTQLQPGLGIPTSAIPTADFQGEDEIEMPADYVGRGPVQDDLVNAPQQSPGASEGAPVPPVVGATTPPPDTSQTPVVTPETVVVPGVDAISGPGAPVVVNPPRPSTETGTPPPPTEEEQRAGFDASFERMLDEAVAPVPKPDQAMSTDELEVQGQMAQDQALKMRMSAAKADAMMKAEEARRSTPHLIALERETTRIMDEKQAELRQYISDVRRGYEEAAAAARRADEAYPDPDDLLGGAGSWTRALGLALSAAYAGHPGSAVAAAIDQQIKLGQAAAEARYQRLKAKAGSLADLASKRAGSIDDISKGYDGMLDAARQRVASRLQVVANGLANQKAQAGLLTAAAELLEKNVKDRYDRAKTIAEIREKEAQADKERALAAKARGLGGGGGSPELGKTGFFNPWTRQHVEFPDGVKLSQKQRDELSEAGEGFANFTDMLDELRVLFSKDGDAKKGFLESFSDKFKTVNQARIDSVRSALIGALGKMRAAGAMGDKEFERFSAEIPDQASILQMTPSNAIAVLESIYQRSLKQYENKLRARGVDPTQIVKTANQNVSRPEAPKEPSEYFNVLMERHASVDKGAPTAPTQSELIATIDSGVERAIASGWDTDRLLGSLQNAKKNLAASYAQTEKVRMELERKSKDPKFQSRLAQVIRLSNAQTQALLHLENLIKGQAEQQRSEAEKRRQKEGAERERVKSLEIRGSSRSGGRQ